MNKLLSDTLKNSASCVVIFVFLGIKRKRSLITTLIKGKIKIKNLSITIKTP